MTQALQVGAGALEVKKRRSNVAFAFAALSTSSIAATTPYGQSMEKGKNGWYVTESCRYLHVDALTGIDRKKKKITLCSKQLAPKQSS